MIKFWFKNHDIFSYGWLIFLLIFQHLDSKYQYLSTFQVLLFLGGITVVNLLPLFFKKRQGCLYRKNKEQVNSFFERLYYFKNSDLVFYNEQVSDLQEDELEQFNMWVFDNKY
jgi:hypothetical protein